MADTVRATGGCLCEGVRYEVRGELREVHACHCSQCAKTSGNYLAATACDTADLVLLSDRTLSWYKSSDEAERGFCRECGGNLFWRPTSKEYVAVTAGTLDPPTGLRLTEHIFVGSKSDFYDIADGLPQKDTA